MAQTFRQRIAQAEAMARADMLRFQPEVQIHYSFTIQLKHIDQTKGVRLRHSTRYHRFGSP